MRGKIGEDESGVLISIYRESRTRSKRIKSAWLPSRRTRGYDRHTQLLTYAQELRRADAQHLKRPFKGWKPKKRRWAIVERIGRLFSRFRGTKRQWKYESIVREDYNDAHGKWSYGRKTKSHFCKKLRCFLKKISGGWKCNN